MEYILIFLSRVVLVVIFLLIVKYFFSKKKVNNKKQITYTTIIENPNNDGTDLIETKSKTVINSWIKNRESEGGVVKEYKEE